VALLSPPSVLKIHNSDTFSEQHDRVITTVAYNYCSYVTFALLIAPESQTRIKNLP